MEEYFGFYQKIRDNIYDFRIKDNYKELKIFNLAIIIATKLNIKYFYGFDETGQLKYFNFIDSRERFIISKLTYTTEPYIVIYTQLSNVYLRIMNSEYECLELKLELDFELNTEYKEYYNLFKINKNINESSIYPSKNCLHLINCLMKDKIYSYSCLPQSENPEIKKLSKLTISSQSYKINIPTPYYGLLYLDLKNNKVIFNIEITHDEFKSLLFNCFQTPLITNEELNIGDTIICENYDKYIDIRDKFGFAIDPSFTSKDKDDAIRFEEVDNYEGTGKNVVKMFVYISDVSPYVNLYNPYLFNYCVHKQETEYIGETLKYALLDPYLSENNLSLMGDNKNAIEIMIIYEKINDNEVYDIPYEVNVQRVKNLDILYTTYTDIHNNIIDENRDHQLLDDDLRTRRILFNNFSLKNDHDILMNLPKIFKEQELKINGLEDSIKDHLKLFHKYYSILNKCLVISDNIQPIYPEFYYQNNHLLNKNLYDDIYERWIHKLIEITALESNKYLGLIQYKYVSENNYCGQYNIKCDDIRKLHIKYKQNPDEITFLGFYKKSKNINPEILCELNPTNIINERYNVISDCFVKSNDEIIRNEYNKYDYDTNEKSREPKYIYSTKPNLLLSSNTFFSTQFTSPLRRILDILVHNLLFINYNDNGIKKLEENFNLFKLKDKNFNDNIKIYNRYYSLFNYLNNIRSTLCLYKFNDVDGKKYQSFYCFFIDSIYTRDKLLAIDNNTLLQLDRIEFINPYQLNFEITQIKSNINNTITNFIFDIFLSERNNYLQSIIKWIIGDNTLQIFDQNKYNELNKTKIDYTKSTILTIMWISESEIYYVIRNPRKILFIINKQSNIVTFHEESIFNLPNMRTLIYNQIQYNNGVAIGGTSNDNILYLYNKEISKKLSTPIYLIKFNIFNNDIKLYTDDDVDIEGSFILIKNRNLALPEQYNNHFKNCLSINDIQLESGSKLTDEQKYLKYKIKYLNLKKLLDM